MIWLLVIPALAAAFVIGVAARALILAATRHGRHVREFDRDLAQACGYEAGDGRLAGEVRGVLPRTEPAPLDPLSTSTGRPVPDVLRPHPDGTCSVCGDPHHAAPGHDMVMSILAAQPKEPGWDVARLALTSVDDMAAAFDTSQFEAIR